MNNTKGQFRLILFLFYNKLKHYTGRIEMNKKIFFVIAANLFLGIVINPCFAMSGRPSKPADAVIITGKVTDKAAAKPIAGAQVSLQVQNTIEKAASDRDGKYTIRTGTFFWFRTATLKVSQDTYAPASLIFVIPPGRQTIQKDIQLKDNQKPTLEITSPKDNEEVFTGFSIEIKYDDKGSGIDLNSIKIFVQSQEVTKYIKTISYQGALCVIPEAENLAPGGCEILARVKDRAGNQAQQSISVTLINKEDNFIRLGKEALADKDTGAAYGYFKQALDSSPKNKEANFYFGLMRMAGLLSKDEVLAILQDMGFTGPGGVPLAKEHLNPFDLQVEPPAGIEKFNLPDSSPSGLKIQNVIERVLLPEVDRAIKNLDTAAKDKGVIATMNMTIPFADSGNTSIDYGDAQIIKSTFLLIKALMSELLVHDIDISPADIKTLSAQGPFTIWRLLELYPDLLRVKSGTRSLQARAALVAAIDSFNDGFSYILTNEAGRPAALLKISRLPQYRKEALLFADELKDIKKSLMGTPERVFSLRLNQAINAGNFFTRPFDFGRALGPNSAEYLLGEVISPYFDYAARNFSRVKPGYSEFLPPDTALYKGKKKEVDFTDISAVLSTSELARTAFLSLLAYDLKADIRTLAPGAPNDLSTHLQDTLDNYPHLFYLKDASSLGLAREAFARMVKSYAAGADYYLTREDAGQSDDLLVATEDFRVNLERYKAMLEELGLMKNTLIDPRTETAGDELHVDLGEFFARYKDVRKFMPQFDANNNVIPGTYPDETFGGILPDNKFNE